MTLIYRGIPTYVYVEIIAHINIYGKITPQSVIWTDGREFPISKVQPVGRFLCRMVTMLCVMNA